MEANDYVLFVLHIAVAVFILCGNALTALAISRTPELRAHRPHLYVLNLAVADGLVGVGCFHCAFQYVQFSRETFQQSAYLCLVVCALTYFSACESLLTLSVMAADRLVYIVYPYKYPGWFTEKRTRLFLGLSWLTSAVFGAVPVFFLHAAVSPGSGGCGPFRRSESPYDRFALPLQILVVVFVTGGCYVKIACVARRQRNQIELQFRLAERGGPGTVGRTERQPGKTSPRSESSSGEDATTRPTTTTTVSVNYVLFARRSKKYPSVGLFVTVNCLFAVCWIPSVVHFFLLGVVPVPHTVTDYVLLLAMSNSAMNTVVLACKNKQFARAYRTLLGQRCSGCRCRCADDLSLTV